MIMQRASYIISFIESVISTMIINIKLLTIKDIRHSILSVLTITIAELFVGYKCWLE